MTMGRYALVGLAVVLLAVLAVRVAFVKAYSELAPAKAASLWPDHPQVVTGVEMVQVANSARLGRDPSSATIARILTVAHDAPLAPEPFLVRGIAAQQNGQGRIAELAFQAARTRAPREPAPRYFLSQHYLTSGDASDGLRELATLARLMPGGVVSVAPTIAAYAKSDGAARQLRALFRSDPTLEQPVLAEMAKDPGNADLILAIASTDSSGERAYPKWAPALLAGLMADGEYLRAYRLWQRVSGERPRPSTIFNPSFDRSDAPPPFNWTFAQEKVGLAEPDGRGSLRVIYYGRTTGALASQVLLLSPGAYTFTSPTSGGEADQRALNWSMICMPSGRRIAAIKIGSSEAEFFIPGEGCVAQRLTLLGTAADVARETDVTVGPLQLRKPG